MMQTNIHHLGRRVLSAALSLVLLAQVFPFAERNIPAAAAEANQTSSTSDPLKLLNSMTKNEVKSEVDNLYATDKFTLNSIDELRIRYCHAYMQINDHKKFRAEGSYAYLVTDGTVTSNPSASYTGVSSVGVDATGSGKKDWTAFIGYDRENKKPVVWINNASDNAFQVRGVGDGSYPDKWMDEINPWEYGNYFTITAGDYDGDGKDSFVCTYFEDLGAANDRNNSRIIMVEFYYNPATTEFEIGKYEDLSIVMPTLNKQWTKFTDDDSVKCAIPVVQTASGDVNRDGKDELVTAVGWSDPGSYTLDDLLDRRSYLSILDMNTASRPTLLYQQPLSEEDIVVDDPDECQREVTYKTMRFAGLAVEDLDANGYDEILVAGLKNSLVLTETTGTNPTICDSDYNDAIEQSYYTMGIWYAEELGCFQNSEFLNTAPSYYVAGYGRYGLFSSDSVQAPTQLAVAAMDGGNVDLSTKGAKIQYTVFLGGNLYTWDADSHALSNCYTPQIYSSSSIAGGKVQVDGASVTGLISNTWIMDVEVGNFNADPAGRQQIIVVSAAKVESSNNIHVFVDYLTGIYEDKTVGGETTYGLTGKPTRESIFEMRRHLVDSADGSIFTCTASAVDTDNDSVIGKYVGKHGYYTAPAVLTILQAAPYYKELTLLSSNYESAGMTSLGKTTSQTTGVVSSMTSSLDFYIRTELSAGVVHFNEQHGITKEWTREAEDSLTTEQTITFKGDSRDDHVIISRIPTMAYEYEVQNGDTTSKMVIAVPQKMETLTVTFDEYNAIAEAYNKQQEVVDGKTPALEILTRGGFADKNAPRATHLPSIPGKPTSYYTDSNRPRLSAADQSLSAEEKALKTSWFDTDDGMNVNGAESGTTEVSFTTESSRTISQSSSIAMNIGIEALFGFEEEGYGFFCGGGLNFSEIWGSGKYVTNMTSITKTGSAANLPAGADSDNFGFTAYLGSWNIKMNAGNGNYNTVPVIGYMLENVKEGVFVEPAKNLKNVSGNAITWKKSADAVKYYIYSNGKKVATTRNTSFAFQSLIAGKTYEIDVVAVSDDNLRSESATISFKAVSLLAKPTGLSRNSTSIFWDPVAGAKSYKVYVINPGNGKYVSTFTGVTGTSFTFRGMKDGGSYYLRVCAVDKNGVLGKYVNTKTFTYDKPTVAPVLNLKRVSGNAVSWTKSANAVSYVVYLNDKKVSATRNNSFAFQTLKPGTTYKVGIAAVNAKGVQSPVVSVRLKAVTILTAPAGLKRSNLTLSWNAVTGAKSYKVYLIETDAKGTPLYVDSKVVTGKSYTFDKSKLEKGKSYKLRVCAVDKNGYLGKYVTTKTFVAQ